jgi:NAD(P)-dependent dehydrogenase (short-subunit alcohol dehydrogenase family)
MSDFLAERANLPGKVAAVLGGAGGIGRAVTLALARGGVDVALCDIAADAVAGIVSELKALGRQVIGRVLDVTQPSSLEGFYTDVGQAFERLDIVVNVVVGVRQRPFMTATSAQCAGDIQRNYGYLLDSVRHAVPLMRRHGRGGRTLRQEIRLMPLPPPAPRKLLTRRAIVCEGYCREDGSLDVEGHLTDTKGHDHSYGWRPSVAAGEPIHEMWARMTLDAQLTIVSIIASVDAAPYPTCRHVVPNLTRLVGLKVAGGFKQRLREQVGSTEGCTHVVTLLEAMANNAVQTSASSVRERGSEAIIETFGVRDRTKHPLLDTCLSYAAASPVVAKLWPHLHRPRSGDGRY